MKAAKKRFFAREYINLGNLYIAFMKTALNINYI